MPEPLHVAVSKGAKKKSLSLTTGSTFRHVLRLGLPSMFAMGLQASYDIVDLIWIGRLDRSAEAMAAVTVYGFLYALIAVLNQVVDVGSSALIARYWGAHRFNAARIVTGQALSLKLALCIPVAVLGAIFGGDIYRLYGSEPVVVELGVQYSVIMFLGLPLVFWGLTLNTAFRASGEVKKPLYMAAISIGINIVLDPLLIFGVGPFPKLGVRGAAIASVFAQALLVMAGLYYILIRKSQLRLGIVTMFYPRLGWAGKILGIGALAAVGDLLRTLVAFFTGWVVLKYGSKTMAAFGVGSRLLFSVFIPIFAIGTAISALIGHNLGAKKPERAKRSVINGTFISLVIGALLALPGLLIPWHVMRVFTSDSAVIEIGIQMMQIGFFAIIGVSVATSIASAFWGAGDTLPPMVVWIVATVGVQLPVLLLSVFLYKTGPEYVWFSVSAGAISAMLLASAWLAKGSWLKKKI